MADRPDHDLDLADRLDQIADPNFPGVIGYTAAEDLRAAAAARLRQLTNENERLRELAGFLIDACATHRIGVPIHSSLLDLAAAIAAGDALAAVGDPDGKENPDG